MVTGRKFTLKFRMSISNEEDEIEDDDDDTPSSRVTNDMPSRNSSTGFYCNPKHCYKDYTTAYLNALLLLGIFQKPQDLKPSITDSHPIQTILRNAMKNGFTMKIMSDVKACNSGVYLCKSNSIWYAVDVSDKRQVDSKTGEIQWTIMENIGMLYKIEK